MNEQQFNDYFIDVATRLEAIGHTAEKERFFIIDEVGQRLRNAVNHDTYVMVVKHESIGLNSIENLATAKEIHQCSFSILQKCKVEDKKAVKASYSSCYEVASKVIAKMVKDLQEYPTMNDNIMRWLQPDSIRFDKIGPVAEHHYGWEISFQLLVKAGCQYKYNENDWLP